ncbi:hypothetical protein [Streptomyces sp. CC208A]|uniref:hypothetical protein n=1 Tax=Streptomyces sp. CC208A TaxID=3044573 RepID=UPI0024A8CEC6|nr:hypothetical protein [Streptomyces sp. CC208A]
MSTPTTAPPSTVDHQGQDDARGAETYRALIEAMGAAGLPTEGVYRDSYPGPGDTWRSLYEIGSLDEDQAVRLTAVLRAARRTP